jgi:hypothetical protein
MAACLLPSLLLLPWLAPTAVRDERPTRAAELARAVAAFAVPNLVVWAYILVMHYGSNAWNLYEDMLTGRYSLRRYGQAGNLLGAANQRVFRLPSELGGWSHLRDILFLLFVYSPVAWLLGLCALLRARSAAVQEAVRTPQCRFFLSLLVPYAVFVGTVDPDLGVIVDWDLFSHIAIFALYATVWTGVRNVADRVTRVGWGVGLAVSFGLTAFLLVETHRSLDTTGIAQAAAWVGISPRPGSRSSTR